MADTAYAKKELLELIKIGDNKSCVDCGAPNPQWASLGVAAFICLSCAGVHRGFGVHISFVRSCTMDTWSSDQLARMHIGGNGPFKAFLKEYEPKEAGGFREGMPLHDKYHCWATTQYREMLTAKLAGDPWSPSLPPEPASDVSSSGALRKSRAGTRGGLSVGTSRDNSASPAASGAPTPVSQKTANETYFASLGETNASRPEDLPPSQGGRYVGFGSTPSPQPGASNPNFGLSSAAAPSFADLQADPGAALTKGWGFLSALVTSTARAANESVIQPGIERARDPALRAVVDQYTTRAAELGRGAWELGVDVAGNASSAWTNVGGGQGRYGHVGSTTDGEGWDSYRDDDDRPTRGTRGNDGWDDWDDKGWSTTPSNSNAATNAKLDAPKVQAAPAKKDDEWEDW